MEWKSWFEKRILDRGKEYNRSGLVEELEISDNEIKALVIGNDEYEVSISVRNGEIENMDCTCPYADEGFYCKHMAAVLYAYEAAPKAKYSAKELKPKAEELVLNADEKTIRGFLINALKKDKKLLDSFTLAVSSSSGDISISSYKKRIDDIISKYTDRHGYIDYYAAGDFIDAALDFVYDELYKLTEKGYIKEAFELSTYLFKEVSDVDIDDSDGGCQLSAQSFVIFGMTSQIKLMKTPLRRCMNGLHHTLTAGSSTIWRITLKKRYTNALKVRIFCIKSLHLQIVG